MMKPPAFLECIAPRLVRTSKGRECVDGPKSRQRRASVVQKLKVYVRSAEICVPGNALLVIKPRDGTLQEVCLLSIAALGLELRGWLSVSRPCLGLRPPPPLSRRLTSVTHTGRSPAMRHMSETKVLKSSRREEGLY